MATKKNASTTEAKAVQPAPTTPKKTFGGFKRKSANPTAPVVYKLISRGKDRKGQERHPVILMLKAIDVIYDPETETNRKIQYIQGESSIFADEQTKGVKPKETINFNNGILMVPHSNPTLKKYLDTCNYNVDNPHRNDSVKSLFSKVDKQGNALVDLKSLKETTQAITVALEMPLNQLIGYAKVLGVNTDKSTDEIRWDMKLIAEKNPTDFINGLNDPRTEMKQTILIAAEYGIITLGRGNVSWDNGNVICAVPIGVEPADRLLDFTIEGEGEKVYAEIERRLSSANQ
mgnify:CR=1 FL=1